MKMVLAPAESVIMQCLWESGEDLTVYEIAERLREVYGKEYTNNAVATFMTVLMKKGFVSRYKKHHSHQYHPEVSLDEYRNDQVSELKRQWYHGSALGVLASLVKVDDVSPEDLKKMKELLDEYTAGI